MMLLQRSSFHRGLLLGIAMTCLSLHAAGLGATAGVAPPVKKHAPVSAMHAASRAPAGPSERPARSELRGRLTLTAGRGQQVTPGEAVDSVVYYVPAIGAPAPRPGHYNMYTIDRDFKPSAMIVPFGSTFTFVNQDDVRHNVFSVTPGSAFNVGFQAPGQSADQAMKGTGLVLVSCNVHRSMEGEVMIVPSAYASKVAADGSFALRGLPAGQGDVYFWNPRGVLSKQSVKLPMSGPLDLSLEVRRPRVTTEVDVGSQP
jgi:hypothetical protein